MSIHLKLLYTDGEKIKQHITRKIPYIMDWKNNDVHVLKCLISKFIYRVSVIIIQFSMTVFTETEKCPKSLPEPERTCETNSILSKTNIARGITMSDFKIHYKAIVIKTSWYWHEKHHVDQQN